MNLEIAFSTLFEPVLKIPVDKITNSKKTIEN